MGKGWRYHGYTLCIRRMSKQHTYSYTYSTLHTLYIYFLSTVYLTFALHMIYRCSVRTHLQRTFEISSRGMQEKFPRNNISQNVSDLKIFSKCLFDQTQVKVFPENVFKMYSVSVSLPWRQVLSTLPATSQCTHNTVH